MDLNQTQTIALEATNIGGIDSTSVALSPGVTVLSGRNATNRTSLLQAIMAALGSNRVSVKGDAEEASVTLSFNNKTVTRTLRSRGETVQTTGDPYLDDPLLADLFAFLIESNDVRRAVTTNSDIRDIIMRPVDTDEIEAEIDRLVAERNQLTADLEELAELKTKLPGLEEKRTRLTSDIESTRETLTETEREIESLDADLEKTRAEKNEIERKLSELHTVRNTLEDTGYDLETEKQSLSSLRTERAELETELTDLPDAPAGQIKDLDSEISRLREQKQRYESESSDLQSVVRFNRDFLEGSPPELLEGGNDDKPLTDQLVDGDVVTCWTCNSTVETSQIEETVSMLQDLSQQKLQQAKDIGEQLSEHRERKSTLTETQRERERLTRRQSELEREIEATEETIDDLREQRAELRTEISTLEDELEDKKDETYEEIIAVHREANQLEYELGSLESNLENVEAEITSIETKLETEPKLTERRAQIKDELEELRTAVEQTERQAITEFNEHMETVLELLEYQNLERIWLERTVRDGRQTDLGSQFTLHVVRKTENGTTYQDTADHLSESEREVTGLILALAGYLAHEVYNEVPFVLLDSLEAIDAERIAALISYLGEFSPSLIVALLEEDAKELDDNYHYVTEI